MGVSRRDFFKMGGAAVVAGTVVGMSPNEAAANQRENRLKGATVTMTI
jgi:anaerobic selenocysteine-containing dehydrogenase